MRFFDSRPCIRCNNGVLYGDRSAGILNSIPQKLWRVFQRNSLRGGGGLRIGRHIRSDIRMASRKPILADRQRGKSYNRPKGGVALCVRRTLQLLLPLLHSAVRVSVFRPASVHERWVRVHPIGEYNIRSGFQLLLLRDIPRIQCAAFPTAHNNLSVSHRCSCAYIPHNMPSEVQHQSFRDGFLLRIIQEFKRRCGVTFRSREVGSENGVQDFNICHKHNFHEAHADLSHHLSSNFIDSNELPSKEIFWYRSATSLVNFPLFPAYRCNSEFISLSPRIALSLCVS